MNKQIEEMANDLAKICPDLVENCCGQVNCVSHLTLSLSKIGYRKSTDVERLREELELAERCIYAIEDALYRGADNDYANEAIEEWETAIVALKQKYESEGEE